MKGTYIFGLTVVCFAVVSPGRLGFVVESRVYMTECVRLKCSANARRLVWRLRSQQRQAFNLGVEMALAADKAGADVPPAFDAYKVLTQKRQDGSLPKRSVLVQRAGLSAGLDAVSKWQEASQGHDSKVEYWEGRVASASDSEYEDALEYSQRKLSVSAQRRDRHVEKGTDRLFRSRKRFEREPSNGAALVFHEGAVVRDGAVVLPGGTVLRIAKKDWKPEDGWELTGAVQIVDVTPRVTAITRPEHRKYAAHFQLRKDVELCSLPESEDEVIGVDPGVVIPVMVSDGREYYLPDTKELEEEIKGLQRARARCTYGSHKYRKITRSIRARQAAKSNLLDNACRHIAKDVAKTKKIKAVASEDKNAKQLSASAKGTAEHPGKKVAQKRGLNRALSKARFGGIRRNIERACAKEGKHYIPVPAAGTSITCHRCGSEGTRETQAVFQCSKGCFRGNADYNGSYTVKIRAWQRIDAARRSGRPSSGGLPGGKPGKRGSVTKTTTNKSKGKRPTTVNPKI